MRRRVEVGTDRMYGARKRDRFATAFRMGITEAEGGCCHTVAEGITTQREGRVSGNGKTCDYLIFVVLSYETGLSLSQALSENTVFYAF